MRVCMMYAATSVLDEANACEQLLVQQQLLLVVQFIAVCLARY
jgi:hypothetical protein